MDDTQRNARAAQDTASESQTDEPQVRQDPALPLRRLLANPRRIRRS